MISFDVIKSDTIKHPHNGFVEIAEIEHIYEVKESLERLFQNSDIPYLIIENEERRYKLLVDEQYISYALISLSRTALPSKSYITDYLHFSIDPVAIVLDDYINKNNLLNKTNDGLYQLLATKSLHSLSYYIEKGLLKIHGITNIIIIPQENSTLKLEINLINSAGDIAIDEIEEFLNEINQFSIEDFYSYEDIFFRISGVIEIIPVRVSNEITEAEMNNIKSAPVVTSFEFLELQN